MASSFVIRSERNDKFGYNNRCIYSKFTHVYVTEGRISYNYNLLLTFSITEHLNSTYSGF